MMLSEGIRIGMYSFDIVFAAFSDANGKLCVSSGYMELKAAKSPCQLRRSAFEKLVQRC